MSPDLEPDDARLIAHLHGGFPLSERPYAQIADELDMSEASVIARLERLLAEGVLSRFGPLYDTERLGGAVALAAMAVPEARFDAVAAIVNGFEEVAHNYARDHAFNMWFVLAAPSHARLLAAQTMIEALTGLEVLLLPKEREYFLELRLTA